VSEAAPNCVFCKIVARKEPAEILFEDDDIIVFRNRLKWVPVMLLVAPKQHMQQWQLWEELMHKAGPIAVKMGEESCPGGFRVLSNFGRDAMQSQEHAHIHVVGGTRLIEYA
jgi:histidine triad (HIT) family protein